MEKAKLPSPAEHPSFQKHRREVRAQILVPVGSAALIVVAVVILTVIATFRQGGDVARWSAISTIWIIVPILILSLIFLAALIAMIYGMAQLLNLIPPYTGQAQRIFWRAQGYIQRGADLAARPILGLEGLFATVRSFFGRK
ncbi:MAG: hypothetical protein HFACDABA_02243 [Anaerolineales bacterium]|nr:hypothetical protein [Anaerolineales bacterium]